MADELDRYYWTFGREPTNVLTGSKMIGFAVAFRFFAFNAHDPRMLGRVLGLFVRGLVGAVGFAAAVGAIVAIGMWCMSSLGWARQRLADRKKRAGSS